MKAFVYSLITAFTLTVMLSMVPADSSAQTPRRRAKPMATPPTRVLTGAEIISEGGTEEEPVEITPVQRPTPKPPTTNAARYRDLNDRLRKLEGSKGSSYDEQQKRLLTNLDIITRAESRSESLRKQVFEMVEKENTIRARLDQIEYDIRPEVIERTLQIAGSLRPEEIRDGRRRVLEAERNNLQSLLTSVQANRTNLEANLLRAEQMVEKLRSKLEKDIDNSLVEDVPEE
jgi:hypothetical protein